jgi:hypothetical protein
MSRKYIYTDSRIGMVICCSPFPFWEGGEGDGTAHGKSNQPFALALTTAVGGYCQGEWQRQIRPEQRSRDLSPSPAFLSRKAGSGNSMPPLFL